MLEMILQCMNTVKVLQSTSCIELSIAVFYGAPERGTAFSGAGDAGQGLQHPTHSEILIVEILLMESVLQKTHLVGKRHTHCLAILASLNDGADQQGVLVLIGR